MNTGKSILLFNSPIPEKRRDVFEMQGTFPRIGIASIAANLKKNGIRVEVVDPFGERLEITREKIQRFRPDIVGIPAFTYEIGAANRTAKFVKRYFPEVIRVVGGAHVSALPERTLHEYPNIDIVVVAEGERAMVDIAQNKELDKIPGIAFRGKRGKIRLTEKKGLIENLDDLPMPAWELYDLEKYRTGGVISGDGKKEQLLDLPVEGARGCPFDCKFCFRLNGKSIRFKSSQRIVDEVERNVNQFGADTVFFTEGTFGVNKKCTHEMCDELIHRGLHKKITWSTGGRVNVLDKPLLRKMKTAGCVFLGYGVESGHQVLLDKMGKGTTVKQIYDSFQICRQIGIKTEANFILGHIGETQETIKETIRFARKLKADYANFAIMVPFPGTEIFSLAVKEEEGLRIKTYDWRLYGKQIGAAMEFKHISNRRMIKLQNRAYLYFFLTPKRFKRLFSANITGTSISMNLSMWPITFSNIFFRYIQIPTGGNFSGANSQTQ